MSVSLCLFSSDKDSRHIGLRAHSTPGTLFMAVLVNKYTYNPNLKYSNLWEESFDGDFSLNTFIFWTAMAYN